MFAVSFANSSETGRKKKKNSRKLVRLIWLGFGLVPFRSINSHKRNFANIQPHGPHTRSMTPEGSLLHGLYSYVRSQRVWVFSRCGHNRVWILATLVINRAWFLHSCPVYSSLELSMLFSKSCVFTIIEKTINKSLSQFF